MRNRRTFGKTRANWYATALVAAALAGSTGCQVLSTQVRGVADPAPVTNGLASVAATGDAGSCQAYCQGEPPLRPPAELAKVSLPTYRIEPPDVLLIDAVRVAPKDPYFISPLDILQIVVAGTLPEEPIAGAYQVDPTGQVNLGPSYGTVKLEGLTLDEGTDAITRHLSPVLTQPRVAVLLLQSAGQQQIAGEHLVGPDGTINLGIYGGVYLAGLTVEEARQAIEKHLSQFFSEPRVSVDVFAYNSKVYYIISEGAGLGDQVVRVPITGNETVLDAISQIGGISRLSSARMWISRPAPYCTNCDQILPIDWDAITRGANTATNYQLLPGDRIFLAEDRMVALDSLISKLLNPFERMFGFTLLGAQTIQTLQRFPEGRVFF
jgi:polysaccharide export outer membrane protein